MFCFKVNGYSLNWALGYLINELNRDEFLPYEAVPKKIPLNTYLPLMIFLSAGLVLLLAILLYLTKYAKPSSQEMRSNRAEASYKSDTQQCMIDSEATPLKSNV